MKPIIRKTLIVAVLAASAARGQDSRWLVVPNVNALDEENVTPSSPALVKALSDAAEYVLRWRLPQDAAAWRGRRQEVDAALRKAIGLDPAPERTPLEARTLRSHDLGDYRLDNVVFYSRPGFPVTANLYRPKTVAAGRRPAVLCPIGHYLAAGKAEEENQILCIKLAQLGFVVLTYDAIGHGERMAPGNIHHEAGYALLPLGQTIAGWMVWDSMRAIDYLLSLPDVDPERIGITGNSGGGLNTLYTSALDPRIRAAAIAGYVFQFNDWIKHGGPHCTCNYLPSLYRRMEWFEIAGLVAPRPLLMMQGEEDLIFPITGARRAGQSVEALYALLGYPGLARLAVFPGQPHAYSRPFRERMYGWMLKHLAGRGDGGPVSEGEIRALSPGDERLICDAEHTIAARAPSVVELARRQAQEAVGALAPAGSESIRVSLRRLVAGLTAPPEDKPDHLVAVTVETGKVPGGLLEKLYFLSEVGEYIPGLLWKPEPGPARPRTVIVADDRSKAAVADSGMPEALLAKGFAVVALDLRGRGETLGEINSRRDNNYHFVSHSVMWGFPAAGRRAFDLKRAVDFLARRHDVSLDGLAMAGLGDDALPVLLAAASDPRVQQVVIAGYFASFASQIISAKADSREDLLHIWNSSAMDRGRLDNGSYEVDLGAVLPSILLTGDVPDLASLVAPRRLLVCQVRDRGLAAAAVFRARFVRVLAGIGPTGEPWARFEPDRQFDANLLVNWLGHDAPQPLP